MTTKNDIYYGINKEIIQYELPTLLLIYYFFSKNQLCTNPNARHAHYTDCSSSSILDPNKTRLTRKPTSARINFPPLHCDLQLLPACLIASGYATRLLLRRMATREAETCPPSKVVKSQETCKLFAKFLLNVVMSGDFCIVLFEKLLGETTVQYLSN